MSATTYYKFAAFPATYMPKYRHRVGRRWKGKMYYGGYRFGVLSEYRFDTLQEAKREVRRLERIYARSDRDIMKQHEESKLLTIFEVTERAVA